MDRLGHFLCIYLLKDSLPKWESGLITPEKAIPFRSPFSKRKTHVPSWAMFGSECNTFEMPRWLHKPAERIRRGADKRRRKPPPLVNKAKWRTEIRGASEKLRNNPSLYDDGTAWTRVGLTHICGYRGTHVSESWRILWMPFLVNGASTWFPIGFTRSSYIGQS